MSKVHIEWQQSVSEHGEPCPDVDGWRAVVDGQYIGMVFGDGAAVFGDRSTPTMGITYYGSQPLAAEALVRYVEGGGR